MRIWHASDFLSTLFTISDTLQVIKSINELTSWIGCIRWGRQCWAAPGPFWKPFHRHVLKCYSYKIYYIKYITCTHSFKAALITFMLTSWLNWPRHCMHVAYFVLWQHALAPLCVQLSTRCEHSTVSALVWLVPGAEVKWVFCWIYVII